MKKKEEYYFDSKNLRYKKITFSNWVIFKIIFKWFVLVSITTILIFLLVDKFYISEEELQLSKENKILKEKYTSLNEKISNIKQDLEKLKSKENDIYKALFGIKPVDHKNNDTFKVNQKNRKIIIEELIKKGISLNKTIDKKNIDSLALKKLSEETFLQLMYIPSILPVKNIKIKNFGAGFGKKTNLFLGIEIFHYGQDFIVPQNTKIYATANGKMQYAKFNPKNGLSICINHGNGLKTEYFHLKKTYKSVGDKVFKNELIGESGNTGTKSTAPHLHYAVIKNNKYVNPIHFFFGSLNSESYNKIMNQVNKINVAMD